MAREKKAKPVVAERRPILGEVFRQPSKTALMMKNGRKPLTLAQQIAQHNALAEMLKYAPTPAEIKREEEELMREFEAGEEQLLTPSELKAVVDAAVPIIQQRIKENPPPQQPAAQAAPQPAPKKEGEAGPPTNA